MARLLRKVNGCTALHVQEASCHDITAYVLDSGTTVEMMGQRMHIVYNQNHEQCCMDASRADQSSAIILPCDYTGVLYLVPGSAVHAL